MSAESIAISVPEPIAIPTSDLANAGESFIPSPTKATLATFTGFPFCKFDTICSLCCGKTSEYTFFIPTCFAISFATTLLSPVIITVLIPNEFNNVIAFFESSFIVSATAINPISSFSHAIYNTVFPSDKSLLALLLYFAVSMLFSFISFTFPA